jgi:hypothetical protein
VLGGGEAVGVGGRGDPVDAVGAEGGGVAVAVGLGGDVAGGVVGEALVADQAAVGVEVLLADLAAVVVVVVDDGAVSFDVVRPVVLRR